MPVYNTQQTFLKEAILSIIKSQTFKGQLYLIIIDDGSTDPKTIKLLDSCKESHENVILHRLKQNGGLPNALNTGIQIALSKEVDYIARMDSDDLSVPERLET
jgi:glycosyltransferase involved in cell wall biosynthesis